MMWSVHQVLGVVLQVGSEVEKNSSNLSVEMVLEACCLLETVLGAHCLLEMVLEVHQMDRWVQ